MSTGSISTAAHREANGSRMSCTIEVTLGRTEPMHLKKAIAALDDAYKQAKQTLKDWSKE
jgi:hypothetical protein